MSVDDRPAGAIHDQPARAGRRRLLRVTAWLVAVAVWGFVCFTWLFPWVTEMGLDPTLGS